MEINEKTSKKYVRLPLNKRCKMANTAEVVYKGELRCEAMHVHSGTSIITDAPTDNLGKGEAFSPTDLLATSLACCALTTIAIIAKRDGLSLDITGAKAEVVKVMASGPRRVSEIHLNVSFTKKYTDEEKKLIEHTFEACPVARSLHPDLKQIVKFTYL